MVVRILWQNTYPTQLGLAVLSSTYTLVAMDLVNAKMSNVLLDIVDINLEFKLCENIPKLIKQILVKAYKDNARWVKLQDRYAFEYVLSK